MYQSRKWLGRRGLAIAICLMTAACRPGTYAPVRRPVAASELQGQWIRVFGHPDLLDTRQTPTESAEAKLELHPDFTCEAGSEFAEFLAACNAKPRLEKPKSVCAWETSQQSSGVEATLVVSSSTSDHLPARVILLTNSNGEELVFYGNCRDGRDYMLVRPKTR